MPGQKEACRWCGNQSQPLQIYTIINNLRNLILWQNTETKIPKLHYALQFFDSQLCILHRQCSEPYKSSRVFFDDLVQLVVQKHTSAPKWKLLHWIERGLTKQNAQVCAILCLCPIREHHGNSAQNLNIDFQIVRVLDAGPSTVTIFLNFTEKFVSLLSIIQSPRNVLCLAKIKRRWESAWRKTLYILALQQSWWTKWRKSP